MDNHTPLVSIVIPAYNIEEYIVECIASVQEQTYQNLEIILVDDGSTDGTAAYCDKAAASDARITVLHQKNSGVVSARENGIKHSHGKYLAFVDGDDWIEPDMMAELVAQIGDTDMISVGVYREVSPKNIIKRVDNFTPGIYQGRESMSQIYKKMIYDSDSESLQPMTSWLVNKLYHRSKAAVIHRKLPKDLAFAEDSVFLYKYMLECESIAICDRCLYHYRYREGSAIHVVNAHMLMDINKVYLALLEDFSNHYLGKELLFQIQKWVTVRSCIAINEMMNFDERIYIPEFIINTKSFAGKKLVLYGAGRVGKDVYRQLQAFGYDVVLWVDKEYEYYQKQGLCVKSPAEITRHSYDVIEIAIEKEQIAGEIKKFLIDNGILPGTIVWQKPFKLY